MALLDDAHSRILAILARENSDLGEGIFTEAQLTAALDAALWATRGEGGSIDVLLDLLEAAFEPVCLYAAGYVMAFPLANQAAQTNDQQHGAEIANYRDMQLKRKSQGEAMMAKARLLWASPLSLGGVRTGLLTITDASPWEGYITDLEEAIL